MTGPPLDRLRVTGFSGVPSVTYAKLNSLPRFWDVVERDLPVFRAVVMAMREELGGAKFPPC